MAIPLTVDGTPYSYPQQGDVGYAGQATAWAQAVTTAIANLEAALLRVGVRAHISTPQTSIGAATVVKFDVKDFDNQSGYNVGNGVFTVPASCGGDYAITATIVTSQASAAGNQTARILKNGSPVASAILPAVPAGTANAAVQVDAILQGLVPTDAISVDIATSGGTLSTVASNGSQLSIQKLAKL